MREKYTKKHKYLFVAAASIFAVISVIGISLYYNPNSGFQNSEEIKGDISSAGSVLREPRIQPEPEKEEVKKKETSAGNEKDEEYVQPKESVTPSQQESRHYAIRQMHLPLQNSAPRGSSNITHVVIHFMSNAAQNPQNPYNIEDIRNIFVKYGFSAHYVIGRDGTIYNMVPENRVAFHAGTGSLSSFPQYTNRLNNHSIGIELLAVGTREEMAGLISASAYNAIKPEHIGYTNSQYEALSMLLSEIYARHPSIKRDRNHIVGHDEYAPGRKTDPGSLFDWTRIGF